MSTKNGARLYVGMGIVAITAIALALIFKLSSNRTVTAFISDTEIYVGDSLFFNDETKNAKQWRWDFGDGYTATTAKGYYAPQKSGKYMLRLKVDDDNDLVKDFGYINVKDKPVVNSYTKSDIVIDASNTGFVNDPVYFFSKGKADRYYWYYNASVSKDGEVLFLGNPESAEPNPSHTYTKVGMYDVVLITEEPADTIFHRIKIALRPGQIMGFIDSAQNEIKEHLQAIASRWKYERTGRESFNDHYNYILSKYLSNNHNLEIALSNEGAMKFYDYCQKLHNTGISLGTIIDEVKIQTEGEQSTKITQLEVTEHNTKN